MRNPPRPQPTAFARDHVLRLSVHLRAMIAVLSAGLLVLTGCSIQTMKDMRTLPYLSDNPENQEFVSAVRSRGVPVPWKSTLAQEVCHNLDTGTGVDEEVRELGQKFTEAQSQTIVYWAITMACWEGHIAQRRDEWKDAATGA